MIEATFFTFKQHGAFFMRINLDNIWKNKKPLALAMAIKFKHSSSVITNFSYLKISQEFGLDRRTVKRYFDVLKKMRILEFNGKNLIIKKMYSDNKLHRNVKLTGDLKQNEINLNFILFKHKIIQQEYNIKRKESLNKCTVKKNGVLSEEIRFSMKTIAKIMDSSLNKSTEMLKAMPIDIKRNVEYLGKFGKYGKLLPNCFVSKAGNVYLIKSNSYCLRIIPMH